MSLSKILRGVAITGLTSSLICLGFGLYNCNKLYSVPGAYDAVYEDHGWYVLRDYNNLAKLPSPNRETSEEYLEKFLDSRTATGISLVTALLSCISAAALEDIENEKKKRKIRK